jgi:hypothetical protein
MNSSTKTVDVPQTPVKDQNNIGFCWAYATNGFLESILLKKSGQAVDLSEEAIGFYRMAEELRSLSRRLTPEQLVDRAEIEKALFEGLEGWDLTFNPDYNPGFRARGSLELVRDYGVVPEYAWSFKFLDDATTAKFFDTVLNGFVELNRAHGRGGVTREMAMDLLASPGAYGSRPPESFTWTFPGGESKVITAKDFAANIIGFTPDDFTYMTPDTQIGYDQLVKATKLSLARGLSVPLSYIIYEGSQNDWDASYSAAKVPGENPQVEGGHAVLMTDFVNAGGVPGAVSSSVLTAELAKPASDLDFVVFKNSWSTSVQSPRLRLPGYFTMDQSYIRLLAKKPTDITIVVPRDIAFQVRYNQ